MNTEIERPTAVIYQFPIRRSAQVEARHTMDVVPAYEAAVIDGWYHAEAIRQTEPVRHS